MIKNVMVFHRDIISKTNTMQYIILKGKGKSDKYGMHFYYCICGRDPLNSINGAFHTFIYHKGPQERQTAVWYKPKTSTSP